MSGYKIGMAEEAVIADLTAKLAECKAQKEAALRIADQHSDVVNNMILQLTECEKDRDAWENACAHWEKEAIESQAREAKLREALNSVLGFAGDVAGGASWWDEVWEPNFDGVQYEEDDTALKEYRKKVLLDAAEWFDDGFEYSAANNIARDLRRMAEE